jgi:uncharacterized alpha-E superfamily protein
MFRYLERSENIARLIDAGIRMALTRDSVAAEEEWRSIVETAGQGRTYEQRHRTYTGIQVWNFMLRNRENPQSVLTMMEMVRTNARLARNAISSEVWEAVNEAWLTLKEDLAQPVGQNHVGNAAAHVRRFAIQAHGAMQGSMLRSSGYHFARAGSFIERADSIARTLDIKYYLLLPSLSYVGSSLDTGQWETVLRSVAGDRAFRSIHAGRQDARSIVEFLVLDDRFPRSLAFSHSALRDELAALARLHGREGRSNELMRASDMRLSNLTIDDVFDQGLHEFLVDYSATNAAIAEAVAEDYRFHA